VRDLGDRSAAENTDPQTPGVLAHGTCPG
jgi:hypothetical protein